MRGSYQYVGGEVSGPKNDSSGFLNHQTTAWPLESA